MTPNTKHAKLAPSAAKRWMACPGSIRLSEGIEDTESEAAREGTFAHGIAAEALEGGTPAKAFIGAEGDGFTFDEDMAGHLQDYLDVVEELVLLGGELLVEKKVTCFDYRPDIRGTADALIWSEDGKTLHVIDLKFGAGVWVDVVANPQAMIYGLGALKTHIGLSLKVEEVVLHIVQPRHFRGGHSMWAIDKAELLAWAADELVPAAAATEIADPSTASGEHCVFCPAKPHCPELRETSLSRTQHLFADETLAKPAASVPPVDRMTPEELASALTAFPTIETWMKAVREQAYKEANHGARLSGWKLVDNEGNRQWIDEANTAKILKARGIDPYVVPVKKLLSPAQAEKKIKPAKLRASVIGPLAFKPKKGTVLVPDSDRRKALTVSDGDVFE